MGVGRLPGDGRDVPHAARPAARRGAARSAPGTRVLDVAAGTGNASIPAAAARRPRHRLRPHARAARGRPAPHRRCELDWVEADAEALPFADESFDVVMSAIGVMFAPHHADAADELVRVCRAGGTLGLLCWTPDGMLGALFRTMAPFAPPPPPGASPAAAVGQRGAPARPLRRPRRVADAGARRARRSPRSSAPPDYGEFFKARYGPTIADPRQRRAPGPRGRVRRRPGRLLRGVEPRPGDERAVRDGVPARSRDAKPRPARSSRRDATPSLPRTADTWWSTVLGEITSASAISAFVAPCAQLREHLALARRQPSGRRAARRAADRAGCRLDAVGAQLPAQVRRHARRAELVEHRERLERSPACASAFARARSAARSRARPRRAARQSPAAASAQGSGSSGCARHVAARPAQPERQLGPDPGFAARVGQRVGRLRSRSGSCSSRAVQPRVLGAIAAAAGARRCSSPVATATPPRLLERRGRLRVAAARLQPAERRSGRGRGSRPAARPARARRARRPRRRPVAAVQVQVRAHAEHVLDVAVELALRREGEAPCPGRPRTRGSSRRRENVSVARLIRARHACSSSGLRRARRPPRAARGPARDPARRSSRVPTFVSAWTSVSSSPSARASAARVRRARSRRRRARRASRAGTGRSAPSRARGCRGDGSRIAIASSPARDRLLAAARPPQQARQPAQVVAEPQRVARACSSASRAPRLDRRAPASRRDTP